MRLKRQRYVLDSSALLALLRNEDGADEVRQLLEQAERKQLHLILPCLQYGEILYVTEIKVGKKKRDQVRDLLQLLPLDIAEIDVSHAEVASRYKAMGGISYPDCFVLSLAIERNAKVLTKDREFEKFEKEVGIEWVG